MATHIRGSMATAGQAITAKNHNVIISPEIKRMIGKVAIRQTRVQETEAGQSGRKAKDIVVASGVPMATYRTIAEKSGAEIHKTAQEVADFLTSEGVTTRPTIVLYELDPEKLDEAIKNINRNNFDIVDVMDDRSYAKLLRDMDKFAENHNIYNLQTMSKKQLIDLRNGYRPNDKMYNFIDNAIKLKDHRNKLASLRMAQNSHHHTVKRIIRSKTKDLDAVYTGFIIYDTADSIQRTVKTFKRISERLNQSRVTKAATSAQKAATAVKTTTATSAATGAAGSTEAAGTVSISTARTTAAGTVGAAETAGTVGAGTSAAGAGGLASGAVVAIVVAVILLIFMVAMLIILAFSNTIPGFSSASDGTAVESVYDSQAGVIYNTLREKDSLFIDTVNNFKNTHSPKDITGHTVYGYWDHNSGKQHVITKWENAKTSWINGSGEMLESTSNAKGILSAATVFVSMDSLHLKNTYEKYSHQLWTDTHNYNAVASSVYACKGGCSEQTYYCDDKNFYDHKNSMVIISGSPVGYASSGCITCSRAYCSGCKVIYCDGYHNGKKCTGHTVCPGHLSNKQSDVCDSSFETQRKYNFSCSGCMMQVNSADPTDIVYVCPSNGFHTVSIAIPNCHGHCYGHEITLCLGHIDLSVTATVNHVDDESNSLFDVDSIGKNTGEKLSIDASDEETYDWDGWDQTKKAHAKMLAEDDWYKLYGIGASDSQNFFYTPVSDDVLSYVGLISKYAEMHGIPEYADLIKAVMMQESGGRGLDPMQSSECGYNTQYPNVPNGITSPEYSIDVGVQYLADCLRNAKAEGPSDMEHIKLALQGYNYGPNYITWASNNYGGYTLENAAAYSDMMASQMNWSGYGDKQYVPHVLRYYILCEGNESIVEVALTQIGNVGGEPFWSWYGYDYRVEWCACFVSWCADQCGYIDSGTILKFAYCPTGVNWFKENDLWKGSNYEPVAGDIIFFDWEGDGVTDHVGIVSKTANGTVYTVEGNSKDQCRQKQYAVGSSCIYGYGTPAYPAD